MPIQIVYTEVAGKRNHEVASDEITIQTKPSINDLERIKLAGRDAVAVKFSLVTDYKPSVGTLNVSGILFIAGERIDNILEGEGKDLILLKPAKERVFQALLQDPLILSINLARDLKLPPPISAPKILLGEDSPFISGKKPAPKKAKKSAAKSGKKK